MSSESIDAGQRAKLRKAGVEIEPTVPTHEDGAYMARQIQRGLGRLENRVVSDLEAVAMMKLFVAADWYSPQDEYGCMDVMQRELWNILDLHGFATDSDQMRDGSAPATVYLSLDAVYSLCHDDLFRAARPSEYFSRGAIGLTRKLTGRI